MMTLKPQDIRVGMLTHNNVELRTLTSEDVIFLLTDDNIHYANPVIISESILFKLGYKLTQSIPQFDQYMNGDSPVIKCKYGKPTWEYVLSNGISVEIQYIHEVQNFYRMIEGKELILNKNYGID